MTLENRAAAMAGNHRKFESFAWHARPEDSDRWTIYYTHNRDSGLLDQTNAKVIASALDRFVRLGVVREESHGHWACGWVEGFAIPVYTRRGKITRAFRVLHDLLTRMEDYPSLDDDALSGAECEAVHEAWDDMSRRDRIEACRESGVSILAARHDSGSERMSSEDWSALFDYLRDRWVTL